MNHKDLDSVAACKEQLRSQIRAVEKDPRKVDNPISAAVDVMSLHQSDNPVAKANADILLELQVLRSRLGLITDKLGRIEEELDIGQSDMLMPRADERSAVLYPYVTAPQVKAAVNAMEDFLARTSKAHVEEIRRLTSEMLTQAMGKTAREAEASLKPASRAPRGRKRPKQAKGEATS